MYNCVYVMLVSQYLLSNPFASISNFLCGINLFFLWFLLFPDLIVEMRTRLTKLTKEVKSCAQTPGEALGKAVCFLIDATHKYVHGMSYLQLQILNANNCYMQASYH